MNGALARILLRYVAGLLVGAGAISAGLGDMLASDPDVLIAATTALGVLISAGTEVYYKLAKRWGWPT